MAATTMPCSGSSLGFSNYEMILDVCLPSLQKQPRTAPNMFSQGWTGMLILTACGKAAS